jgi:hypothetical protein
MSKLNFDQKNIRSLLQDEDADFLIPDYQRPYAWGEDECSTLWEDLFAFAFPNNDSDQFDKNNDYFLGPIVTFKNDDGQQEIIDGQQRLTTIMLLLRALYDRFGGMKDRNSVSLHDDIAACIWKSDEFGNLDTTEKGLKIKSEVASDNDKGEFLQILRDGNADPKWRSNYAKNFLYFQGRIDELSKSFDGYSTLFASRIMRHVILLPIEAESQDTALRIFSTLNDRGLPLSDADIFKSQLYKHYSGEGRKDDFIARWKQMEEGANELFHPLRGTPMDELFTRYMYYRRSLLGLTDTTTESLRGFYGRDKYAILRKDATLDDLEALLGFWQRVEARDGFSDAVNRRFAILRFAPNGMWYYLLSVWFLARRDGENNLDDESLVRLLDLTIAFVWAYAIERPGVNSLRTPMFPEMANVVRGGEVTFSNFRFVREDITARIRAFQFTNQRAITRSMLAWWAYHDPAQGLWDNDTVLEVEHIYARKRAEFEPLKVKSNLEALGNKALLEKRVNIRAADYRLADKRKYYEGFVDGNGRERRGTMNSELLGIVETKEDFTEDDIVSRTDAIIGSFVDFMGENGLIGS